jgi:hypothetical protein
MDALSAAALITAAMVETLFFISLCVSETQLKPVHPVEDSSSCAIMKTRILAIIAFTCGVSVVCLGQSSPTTTQPAGGSTAPYNEASVWSLTMVKTKTGLSDEYLKQITGTVKPVYDEEKKQKLILDYKILTGQAASPHDFDILIMVEYPNWAAFDHLRDKMDPVVAKVMGSQDQQRELAVKRLDIREILGAKTMQEVTLK